ncbi:Kinesin KIF26A isoform 2 [Schistosoma japonicum]|uniref:Kinesin KIF26A isoform 2 n=1 Tax=Schistosoma japonicum TaxID=6182 RepID=A0A4Z2D6R0_SCHJA|nr:Kinesin KIF26A isoform 2 [Schistosoma japonicum]
MKTQNALKQQYKNNFHLTLSNSPSTGFSAVSGKLSTSVYRSTRRSGGGGGGGGGPSSSGYESMHTGASELSLSHQDSASDCSGHIKEMFNRRPSLDGYRRKCNSHQHQHQHRHQNHCHHHSNDHQHNYNHQHLISSNRMIQTNDINKKGKQQQEEENKQNKSTIF